MQIHTVLTLFTIYTNTNNKANTGLQSKAQLQPTRPSLSDYPQLNYQFINHSATLAQIQHNVTTNIQYNSPNKLSKSVLHYTLRHTLLKIQFNTVNSTDKRHLLN